MNILLNRLIDTNRANVVLHPVQSANEFLKVFILLHPDRFKCLEYFLCIGGDDIVMLLAVSSLSSASSMAVLLNLARWFLIKSFIFGMKVTTCSAG